MAQKRQHKIINAEENRRMNNLETLVGELKVLLELKKAEASIDQTR